MSIPLRSPTRHAAGELTPAQVRAVYELMQRAYEWTDRELGENIERFLVVRHTPPPRAQFIVWEGEAPLANAQIFAREIRTARGPLRVMALAGVCSEPGRRGQGWGRLVVRAAFTEVDRGVFPVSLFQTAVPEFYAKLGARTVDNRFLDSMAAPAAAASVNPWWDPHVMIYPATFDWPDGDVDLLGPGY